MAAYLYRVSGFLYVLGMDKMNQMTKSNKIFVGIMGVLMATSFVLGVFGFIRGMQESSDDATLDVIEKEKRLPADLAEHILSKRI